MLSVHFRTVIKSVLRWTDLSLSLFAPKGRRKECMHFVLAVLAALRTIVRTGVPSLGYSQKSASADKCLPVWQPAVAAQEQQLIEFIL